MLHPPRRAPVPTALLATAPRLLAAAPLVLALTACGDDTSAAHGGGDPGSETVGNGGAGGTGSSVGGAPPATTSVTDASASTSSAGGGGAGPSPCDDVVCPPGRLCVEDGACIVDLDPDVPAVDAVADFDAIWTFYDESYGAFPAKDVDWSAVRDTFRPRVAAASTDFAAAWEIQRAVATLGDGHTAAYADAVCGVDPGFGYGFSNVGACVAELGDELVVIDRLDDSELERGDVLVSIDGRTAEEALLDRAHQPRCLVAASTPAQDRATRVASLLYQPLADPVFVVRRGDEEVTLTLAPGSNGYLPCNGRLPLPGEIERGPEVTTAVTPDDVLVIRLARFGTFDGEGLVDGPVLDALRSAFEEAADHAGVVLDLRANPGGYVTIYMALASWLFTEPTPLFRCRVKSGPGHDDHAPPFEQLAQPDPTLHYAGPLAVLVDPRSFSAADFTSMWIQATGRGVTVGAPSGGGFGNGNTGDDVAAGFSLGVSDILCESLDGTLLEGHPPPVDIPVELDADDVREGVDTVVDAAAAWVLAQ